MEPRIQYAQTSDGVNIAYWTMGEGGTPLIIGPPWGWSHIALEWQAPGLMTWYERLARHRMIVRFDPRGFGLSQRELDDDEMAGLSGSMDTGAIASRLDSPRVSILGSGMTSAPSAAAFAAERPDAVEHLILCAPSHGKDLQTNPRIRSVLAMAAEDWDVFTETWAHVLLGWTEGSRRAHQWALFAQRSTSQENGIRFMEGVLSFDFSPLLPAIQAQTLVIRYARGGVGSLGTSQLIAAGVKDARLVHIDEDGAPGVHESEAATRAILEFLGDPVDEPSEEPESTLPQGTAIILFLDIADSTALTTKLGDAAYRAKERELDASLRAAITEAGGTPVEGKLWATA